ncbi:hypothetical protein [Rufibacter sp. LB8]|uniref:hypothetical protein n=1 Tax=Rufibacter sp. LB8 TaxID=2777781 RepID=UPI00178C2A84|nr:hypothetical protein [Rufibacter sp. LB8]
MTNLKKLFFFACVAAIIGVQSCNDAPNPAGLSPQNTQAFDVNAFLAQEAEALNQAKAPVSKTVTQADQKAETKTISGLDWAQELAPFSDTDINKPALMGLFNEEKSTNAAGQTQHRFTAKPDASTNVQEVIYTFNSQNQLVQVDATIVQENMLFETKKVMQLVAQPEKTPRLQRYRLQETQKLLFMSEDAYGVEGIVQL